MITTATSAITPDFRRNRLLQALAAGYGALWVLAAIAPLHRFDWFLENLLVFAVVGILAALYRPFPMSDLSYALIALFLALHTIGSHYTYSEVPFGFWVQESLGLGRNHYDRLVHLSFGLLIAYPLWEVVVRAARAAGPWSYVLAFTFKVALSSAYEMLEWLVARIVDPEAALAFLGTQGDVFDAQKDTALGALGALVCLALTAALHGRGAKAG